MRWRSWLCSFSCFFAFPIFAGDAADKQIFHLDAAVEREVGYAQAVRVGNTLYVSGTVGAGEMPAAIEMAYGKLQKTLAAHGLDFRHVVKETVFATRLDDLIKHKHLRRRFYGDSLPAATWVQVDRLYVPEFVIEVELIAAFP